MHRVLILFSSFNISCILKPTKTSKYMYSLLLYNERDTSPIQYPKNMKVYYLSNSK